MPESQPQFLRTGPVVAFILLAAVSLAVVTHPPLLGFEPAFGPMVDDLTAPLAASLGLALFPLLAVGFVLTTLIARHASTGRIVAHTVGGVILVGVAATLADHLEQGGSIGAFLRYALADRFSSFAIGILLGGSTLFAMGLITPRFLKGIGSKLATLQLPERPKREKPILLKLHVPDEDEKPSFDSSSIPISHTPPPVHGLRIADAMTETLPDTGIDFELPPLTLLADPDPAPTVDKEVLLRERATLLEKTFADFGINVKVVGIHTGPVITQYEIALETGLRLNKVTTLSDDIALNLKVPSVRIVAPLPGRNTVGIEVPNEHRQTVRLKELITNTKDKWSKQKLPVFIGKDVEGRPLVYDLAGMPHLLIAGRTGTGKSVCLNSIILSLLYSRTPDECRLIMIDPKMVELSEYGKVPHLMHPVVTKPEKAEAILAWAVDKMEERYGWLSKARVRNIASWNDLPHEDAVARINPASEDERQQIPRKMPYIVIIIDEVGDLLMSMKKEVETHIIRLAQKSRAAGIHVILATQKPTVDVITGLIKSNMPARICFQVASRADSMVVLDEKGADKLLGMGDMLFLQPASSTIVRAQGAYVDDKEIEKTVNHLECDEPNYESELLNLKAKAASGDGADLGDKLKSRDELYEQAIEVVIREQRGSTSLLQRAMGIGYGRASRLIDFMAEDGIVGAYNGSSARDVMFTMEEWQTRKMGC